MTGLLSEIKHKAFDVVRTGVETVSTHLRKLSSPALPQPEFHVIDPAAVPLEKLHKALQELPLEPHQAGELSFKERMDLAHISANRDIVFLDVKLYSNSVWPDTVVFLSHEGCPTDRVGMVHIDGQEFILDPFGQNKDVVNIRSGRIRTDRGQVGYYKVIDTYQDGEGYKPGATIFCFYDFTKLATVDDWPPTLEVQKKITGS